MSLTEMRMPANPAMNATKKQNNGSRPVCMTWAENQADTLLPPCDGPLAGSSQMPGGPPSLPQSAAVSADAARLSDATR
jgi:hypothetical protein